MKVARFLFAGGTLLSLVIALGVWKPLAKADGDDEDRRGPRFRVDPFWPKPLPAPVNYNPFTWPTPSSSPTAGPEAHRWVQGEVAASCTDPWDNVYTFNRGWQVGATPAGGVLQNAQSGAINGNDAIPAGALPSPPVVAFDPDGETIRDRSFGNPTLWLTANHGAYTGNNAIGRSAVMPFGSHGCFVDKWGYLYVGGNGDGIVQKYNPVTQGPLGAAATPTLQIGHKDICDTTSGLCGGGANNSSQVLLNEPPDIAVDPDVGPVSGKTGDIYVADGYGNYRVVVFNPALATIGNPFGYVGQWGQSCGHTETPNGTDTPGTPCPSNSFGSSGGGHPHCVVLGNDGNVYLCDRPNSRIIVIGKTSTWIQPSTGAGCTTIVSGTTPGTPCTAPTPAAPVRVIYIGTNGSTFPERANPAKVEAILFAGTRACDIDLYPNIDSLASQSPTDQKYIVDVALDADNTFLLDKSSGDVLSAFGRCGIAPCPGHNAGEFAYGHMTNVDSKGNVYISETITGRRIQKFVRRDDD